jgi:hypothetical protein
MKPLPGELYMDPTREAYKFFGLHNTLSKMDLRFIIYTLWWEKKLGLFKTEWKDGSKAYKPMSEHHVFMEIMNYIRTRMPVFIKQSGWEPESLLWQSPGICVVHENKLLYRVRHGFFIMTMTLTYIHSISPAVHSQRTTQDPPQLSPRVLPRSFRPESGRY